MPAMSLYRARHTGSSLGGRRCHSEIFLYYSVSRCTVHVPCWANYWLKMLLGKGKNIHYVAASTEAPWFSIYAVWKSHSSLVSLCVRAPKGLRTTDSSLVAVHLLSPRPSITLAHSAGIGQDRNRRQQRTEQEPKLLGTEMLKYCTSAGDEEKGSRSWFIWSALLWHKWRWDHMMPQPWVNSTKTLETMKKPNTLLVWKTRLGVRRPGF